MLSGELDGATPPRLGADAAKSLPNSRQILLKKIARGYASDCATGMIAEFIAEGTARDLSASCADGVRHPPFAKELPARYSP